MYLHRNLSQDLNLALFLSGHKESTDTTKISQCVENPAVATVLSPNPQMQKQFCPWLMCGRSAHDLPMIDAHDWCPWLMPMIDVDPAHLVGTVRTYMQSLELVKCIFYKQLHFKKLYPILNQKKLIGPFFRGIS